MKKLRKICSEAGISKARAVFMKHKSNEARREALEVLLEERDLKIDSSAKEIARVKRIIEQEQDMDGIDASNIIQGGRRRSRVQISYKGLDASDEEEE